MKLKFEVNKEGTCITPCPYRKDVLIGAFGCGTCKWFDMTTLYRNTINKHYVYCKRHEKQKILEEIEKI